MSELQYRGILNLTPSLLTLLYWHCMVRFSSVSIIVLALIMSCPCRHSINSGIQYCWKKSCNERFTLQAIKASLKNANQSDKFHPSKLQELQKALNVYCHLKSLNLHLKFTGLPQYHSMYFKLVTLLLLSNQTWQRKEWFSLSKAHFLQHWFNLLLLRSLTPPTTSVLSSALLLLTSTYTSSLSHSPFFHHPQDAWVREIQTFIRPSGDERWTRAAHSEE